MAASKAAYAVSVVLSTTQEPASVVLSTAAKTELVVQSPL